LSDGDNVTGPGGVEKLSGLSRMLGGTLAKRGAAEAGETVALGRLDSVLTGQTLGTRKLPEQLLSATPPQPLLGVTIRARERKDDARLSAAFSKLREEDTGLVIEPDPETGEISLRGQGEMHLRLAQARLTSRFGVALETSPLRSGYRETIRAQAQARGRHRKQSGGHGQFGDVVLHIRPLPRGEGFRFVDEITGGVVPRNYIPSVEEGVRAYLREGPLGFPVVDIEVRLTDGSYHTVDSSDMAFQQAARLAMQEAMPQAHPVLLEPILSVEIATPDEALAKVTALATSRRGQMLGYDARPGWEGWSLVQALIPEAEIGDLVVELRSATAGVGSFTYRPERLAELLGRQADTLVEQNRRSA
jgi:elongation factor G